VSELKLCFFVKIKPPAHRAYAPEWKTKILTTVIRVVFRGLKFESDPGEIGYAFHPSTIVPTYGAGRAGADIGEKGSFRSGTT